MNDVQPLLRLLMVMTLITGLLYPYSSRRRPVLFPARPMAA